MNLISYKICSCNDKMNAKSFLNHSLSQGSLTKLLTKLTETLRNNTSSNIIGQIAIENKRDILSIIESIGIDK